MARPVGIPMTEEQKELRRHPNPAHSERMKQLWVDGKMEGSRKGHTVAGWNKGQKRYWDSPTEFKKGQTPWNAGKRQWLNPEDHPNWQGGKGTERHRAQGSLEYKAWRSQVFANDNYTCQVCEQHGGVLHADHIKKWSENEELRYSVENGRTLCVACHYYITFKRKMMLGTKWCGFTARKAG